MIKALYFLRKGLWALLSLFFLFLIAISFLYLYFERQLPKVDSLKTVQLQVPLRIYTKDGKLIQEYGEKRCIPLPYAKIPKTLIYALLATEDQRFFDHPGVDILGLGRATLKMLKTGTKSQGGSTITMQVARNFFLTRKKTFSRKFNEILLAIKIDRELSKEKILELYLNKVYLGNRAYGVGAAAQVYYGKSLQELSLAQLAMIAGLPQAPSTQNPIVNKAAAQKRRDHVLKRLQEEGYITQKQYQKALEEPVVAHYHGARIEITAPFVAEMIRQSLYEHYGKSAYTRGYRVYTTIQSNLQLAANQSVEDQLLAYDRRHGYRGPVAHFDNMNPLAITKIQQILKKYPSVHTIHPVFLIAIKPNQAQGITQEGETITIPWEYISWARPALIKGWVGKAPTSIQQVLRAGDIVYVRKKGAQSELIQLPQIEAALVALHPQNGSIQALVGGFHFASSKFNRATQANRQPGSSFKPFLYAAALQKGYTLATLINDAPIVVDDPGQLQVWRPHNVNKTFKGPMRLKEALTLSRNLVSIRILDDLGFPYTLDFLSHFGFKQEQLPKTLSLALGTLSVSPMELASAYAVFANGGFKVEPYLIERITNEQGETLLQANPAIACTACEEGTKAQAPENIAPRVLSEDTAFLMNTVLKNVIQQGTARAAKVLQRQDIAGKTGTTNDAVDTWFVGFTKNLLVTTWVGFDTPQPLHEYAANVALPLWIHFMQSALVGVPQEDWVPPNNIVAVKINPITGLLAKEHQRNSIIEYFRKENMPTEEEDVAVDTPHLSSKEQDSLF